MSIVLRVNKGSALTYDEMDRNQSQFFYSSSLHTQNTILRLHYTGSSALNEPGGVDYGPRYINIDLNPNQQEIVVPTVAGANKEVQFNDNGAFGASSNFVFDRTINSMGIGTSNPSAKLDIYGENGRPAAINLRGFGAGPNDSPHSVVRFYEDQELIGRLGRINIDNSHIYITNQKVLPGRSQYGKIIFSIKGTSPDGTQPIATVSNDNDQKRFGVGTTNPDRQITAVGNQGIGIGNTGDNSLHSYLKRIPSELNAQTTNGVKRLVPVGSDAEGLLISSPYATNGGNVVVNLNTDSNNREGFNIIKSTGRSGADANFATSTVIASFQASGKVGINTNNPPVVGLTVTGAISGSGTLQVGTIATGTAVSTSALVATSTGLVQKIAAAPVPLGGIIMWSGTIANIPDGWTLCDGTGGANGVTVPDLTNRFVVGATADGAGTAYPNLQGGASNSLNAASGSIIAHNHEGNTGYGGGHTHTYKDTMFTEESSGQNYISAIDNVDQMSSVEHTNSSTDSNGNALWSFSINRTTSAASPSTHRHEISTVGVNPANKNLPPYYALAFIIYVGV